MPFSILPDLFGEEPDNQPPAFAGRNLFESDPLLVALASSMPEPEIREFVELGGLWGSEDSFELAHLANVNKPTLESYDKLGRRIDRIDFHPSYHALMGRSVAAGLQGSVWDEDHNETLKGLHHQARAIRFYLTAQVECGHLCPLTMTNAAPAALRHNPVLVAEWVPAVRSRDYDLSIKPASKKTSVTIGMGMTEKQAGTDVRASVTAAEPGADGLWNITGHKWFMSAPMCDAFLILAKTKSGLSCFFMPRLLPDERQNNIRFLRLKNKLGNISNASCEVEFHSATAHLVGAEGHGVRTILDMVTLTRLDCALASAGMMRSALAHVVHHSRHRRVFDKPLIDQPLATRVMADMALDCAAATLLSMRIAEAFDRSGESRTEALFARLMTPVVKYWVCKITPTFIAEAMESLGGNGYIEDWPMARFYREAPVNAIWEGSGNVMCLDVLRALRSTPECLDAVIAIASKNFGPERASLTDVMKQIASMALQDEGSARVLTEQLALTVAASELQRLARADIVDAFLDGRLNKSFRSTYGMMDAKFDAGSILDAMYPEV